MAILVIASCNEKVAQTEGLNLPTIERLQVFIDSSGSLSDPEYVITLDQIMDSLPTLIRAFKITHISVIAFSSGVDLWSSAHPVVILPSPPVMESGNIRGNEAALIFKQYREALQQEANDRLQSDWENQYQLYLSELSDSLANVALLLQKLRKGKGNCTSLVDLARRCRVEGPEVLSLVVTDGLDDCPISELEAIRGANTHIVIYLVPSKKDQAHGSYGRVLHERIEKLKQLMPNAYVIPSYMVTRGFGWLVDTLGYEQLPSQSKRDM